MQTFPEAGIEAYWVGKSNNSGRIEQRRADRQRFRLRGVTAGCRQRGRQAVKEACREAGKESG